MTTKIDTLLDSSTLDSSTLDSTNKLDGSSLTCVISTMPTYYWPFNGNINEIVSNLLGVATNITFGAGNIGDSAAVFNGSDSVINLGANPIGTDVTVTMWCKTSASDAQELISVWEAGNLNNDKFTIRYDGSSSMNLTVRAAGTNTTIGRPFSVDDSWQFVAFKIDRANNLIKIFVDTTSQFTSVSADTTSTSYDLLIGDRGATPSTNNWGGSINELAIWLSALSDADIELIRLAGVAGNPICS